MGNLVFNEEIHDSAKVPDYIISIKSGNKHGIGSTSIICIAFVNKDGIKSKDIEHVCQRGQEFEAGTERSFPIYEMPNMGELETMELTQRDGKEWYVQLVQVVDCFTQEKFTFPVHRWMNAGKKITLKIYDSLLPQDDDNIAQRKKELNEKRSIYEFEWRVPGAMPMTKDTPPDEAFPEAVKERLLNLKYGLVFQSLKTTLTTKKWETFLDLENIYGGKYTTPPDLDSWTEDCAFGARRLFGLNPCLIQLCNNIPDNLPVTNAMLQPIMQNMKIEEAIEKKKLFIINLANLKDLPCKIEENKKKICSPIALFFLDKDQDLMPVAIQLHQTPADDNPIFLPTDPEFTWLKAKLWYSNADAIEHQSATHLGLSHFVMESVCVAIHRCLSPSHPIFRLLTPHFFNLIAINTHGLKKLVSEGGFFDQIVPCGVRGVFENITRAWKNWRLDVQGNLPNDLKHRGVSDPEVLPNYYYRDDGLLYWDAIKKYVTTVVEWHYENTKKLEGDTEIQEFASVLASESGCGIKGVPGDGRFSTCAQLIETLTSFIYISSVMHAAVNSPQYDFYSSPFAGMELRGYPPTNKKPLYEKELMTVLLDKRKTLENMILFMILSSQGPNRIGDHEIEHQFDPIGTKAIQEFRKDLKAIEVIIDARSATRTYSYPYLHPREVTNSIGI